MSDTLSAADLLRELKETRAEAARYRTRAQQYKQQFEAIAAERDQAYAELEDLATKTQAMAEEHEQILAQYQQEVAEQIQAIETERDELRELAETLPEDVEATINDLQGQLRSIKHRDAWGKVVGDKLAPNASVEAVWKLLGYAPDADEIDEKSLQEQVKAALEAHPYLFKPPAQDAGDQTPGGSNGQAAAVSRPSPLANGLASGRGAPEMAPAKFRMTHSQAADPDWKAENLAAIREAVREGRLEVVPD